MALIAQLGTLARPIMGFLDFFRGSSDERVARRYIKALREAGEQRRLTYDPDKRAVVSHDEHGKRDQVRFIGNLAREIQTAPGEEHDATYRRYALSSLRDAQQDTEPNYQLVKARLRVLLKDSGYPDYIALLNRQDFPDSTAASLVYEQLAGDVIACCVEEREHGLRFITQDDLAKWGIGAAKAMGDAKSNVCGLPFKVSDPMPARYVLNDDSFIAARFVNPKMFDGLPVTGEWVAVIPDRDTFFVADSADLETVAGLARLALRQLEANERTISGLPFVLRAGIWHVYEPPESIRALFTNVELQYRARYWADFKVLLEKDLERRGEDVYVATMSVYELEGVECHYSMAVFSKDVDTILPVADRIYLYDDGTQTTRFVHWPDLLRVMGAEMHREPGFPERYRVRSFPTAEQLVSMGARSV